MANTTGRLLSEATIVLEEQLELVCRTTAATCGSPIEVALLHAMAVFHLIYDGAWPELNPHPSDVARETHYWRINTQVKIHDYRVDFTVSSADTKKVLVIECDGHDYHERTKEQAARDRKRDRTLTSLGYCVIRFTGSEIWRDPWQCAFDVSTQMSTLWEDENPIP